MDGLFGRLLLRFASKDRSERRPPGPLLVELLQPAEGDELESHVAGAFRYTVRRRGGVTAYDVIPDLRSGELELLRATVRKVSEALNPDDVDPLEFSRLTEVLAQSAATELAAISDTARIRQLSRLVAFEAVGIPVVFALSLDPAVSEFYVDSPSSTLYLDHVRHGRCESPITLTERERRALETHMDTFRGYTMDFANPSLKNDFEVFGTRLRVSLDLAPLAVSAFSLDVRRLGGNTFSLRDLILGGVISAEAAAFLLTALSRGMNVTIVGETGTGKTTLLNALDEALDPRLRRIYIEDAVETRDLIANGYHQMKLRVDPFERGQDGSRTKSAEITKILHRSPDLVVLGEIQSEEHSRAFFHALSAGIRGLQTFHASSPEQAIRRWREIHGIARNNLIDLDVLVQMVRPERMSSRRVVQGVSLVVQEVGDVRLREVYVRGREGRLMRIMPWERLQLKRAGPADGAFHRELQEAEGRVRGWLSVGHRE